MEEKEIRLDVFLFACRFYKTRSLAKDMINANKVQVNKQNTKVSKIVKIGDEISLLQGNDRKTIIVKALNDKRLNATEAQKLYEETQQSIENREKQREMRKLQGHIQNNKPSTYERRKINKFLNINN